MNEFPIHSFILLLSRSGAFEKSKFWSKSFIKSKSDFFKAQFWPRKKITDHPLILRMKYYHFHHLETMVHNKYKVLGLF